MLKIGAAILIFLEISLIKEATFKCLRKKMHYVSLRIPIKNMYIYI